MGLLSKFMSALIGEPYTPQTSVSVRPQTSATADDATPRNRRTTASDATDSSAYATRPIATVSAIAISRANANHGSLYFFYNESFTFYNESFASAVSVQFAVNAETYAATNAPCRADRTGAKYYRQNRKA